MAAFLKSRIRDSEEESQMNDCMFISVPLSLIVSAYLNQHSPLMSVTKPRTQEQQEVLKKLGKRRERLTPPCLTERQREKKEKSLQGLVSLVNTHQSIFLMLSPPK